MCMLCVYVYVYVCMCVCAYVRATNLCLSYVTDSLIDLMYFTRVLVRICSQGNSLTEPVEKEKIEIEDIQMS